MRHSRFLSHTLPDSKNTWLAIYSTGTPRTAIPGPWSAGMSGQTRSSVRPWSSSRYVDEDDWPTALAQSTRELGGAPDDLAGYTVATPIMPLQVDHDQGCVGIEFW